MIFTPACNCGISIDGSSLSLCLCYKCCADLTSGHPGVAGFSEQVSHFIVCIFIVYYFNIYALAAQARRPTSSTRRTSHHRQQLRPRACPNASFSVIPDYISLERCQLSCLQSCPLRSDIDRYTDVRVRGCVNSLCERAVGVQGCGGPGEKHASG